MRSKAAAAILGSLEQGAASGISFIVMIIATRSMSKESFGIMSIGWQFVIIFFTIASGTIFSIMNVQIPGNSPRGLAAHKSLLGSFKSLAFIIIGILLLFVFIFRTYCNYELAITAGIAAGLSRVVIEIDRRWFISNNQALKSTFLNLSGVSIISLVMICWWRLTARTNHFIFDPLILYATSCCLVSILAPIIGGVSISPFWRIFSKSEYLTYLRYRNFFYWSLPTTLISIFGGIASPFILAIATGASAIAEFNAARTLFGTLQIGIIGLALHAAPRQRLAFQKQRVIGLFQESWIWATICLFISIIALLIIVFFGPSIMRGIFGPAYGQHFGVLIDFALVFVCLGPSTIAGNAINIIGRLKWNLYSSIAAALLTISLMYPVAIWKGISGGASIMVFTELTILTIRFIGLWQFGSKNNLRKLS